MDILLIIFGMLVLLLLKGFFSGSEIALVDADKLKLNHQANQGNKGAMMVLKLFKTPDVLLGTTLVGTNISTVALTTVGAMMMIDYFGENGDLYAFLLFTPLFLIFGEIVPKSVYQHKSDEIASYVIYPLRFFSLLFYPIIFVFSRVARLGARVVGAGKSKQNVFITREQVRTVVEMSERGTNVDVFDRARIMKAIRFADTTVGEAMVPVGELIAINHDRRTRDAVRLVRRMGYNRLPVYKRNVSNIVGIVTLTTWDLMDKELTDKPLEDLIKPALYVTSHQMIDQLLPVLQKREDHMAVVVDEFGSAIGIITIEDILEEVVGEIDVGYDFEEYIPRRRRGWERVDETEEDIYLMDSRLPISEVNEVLGIAIGAGEFHTLSGLLMSRLRHIPEEGESITESGYRFYVESATDRSITKVRVERL
ncbi:MAG: HlyC/CorC family transporter [Gammaproteobacteria bacterium]|nr:MAG: HlyC/CorC family transporter [Gammaproteobacteria bacterium]